MISKFANDEVKAILDVMIFEEVIITEGKDQCMKPKEIPKNSYIKIKTGIKSNPDKTRLNVFYYPHFYKNGKTEVNY